VGIAAFRSAQRRGFAVNEEHLAGQVEFTLDTFRKRLGSVGKGLGVPGGNTTAGYALFALEEGGHARDEVTGALVAYLLARQREDGAWPAVTSRPPSEGSAFINTALALRGLRQYGPPAGEEAGDLGKRIAEASERGRAWLLEARPKDTEDRVGRLRGLAFAARDTEAFREAREELLHAQNEDGSWSQLPSEEGDAYATATVMLALRAAGVKADDPAYVRGAEYLLKTQDASGAWVVETRSRPVQVFFDNGDPGGKSQFISFMATGWAVLALLETLPEGSPTDPGRRLPPAAAAPSSARTPGAGGAPGSP
jgi:N-acyl-D-amino-acid deacylase